MAFLKPVHSESIAIQGVFFQFLHDGEAAIIYSESGIDELCYNSGSKGHLFGNWYWMKED